MHTETERTILLTGGSGFVGARVLAQLGDRYRMLQLPREVIRSADRDSLLRALNGSCPDVIIHTAAISDVGYSEQHPNASYQANVLLPVAMAEVAKATGAKLLSFSSDQVYTGEKERGPFTEDISLHPANVYGRHKLEAEQRVLEILPEAVCLRATWMYDMPGYRLPVRGNLLLNLMKAAVRGESIAFGEQDFRGITYVRQAVEQLIPAMDAPGGVYNFGSENTVDMYTTASAFAEALQLDARVCRAGDREPRSLLMDGTKAKNAGISFDDTLQGISRCIADYGMQGL